MSQSNQGKSLKGNSLMLRTIMGKCLRGITEFLQNPT